MYKNFQEFISAENILLWYVLVEKYVDIQDFEVNI